MSTLSFCGKDHENWCTRCAFQVVKYLRGQVGQDGLSEVLTFLTGCDSDYHSYWASPIRVLADQAISKNKNQYDFDSEDGTDLYAVDWNDETNRRVMSTGTNCNQVVLAMLLDLTVNEVQRSRYFDSSWAFYNVLDDVEVTYSEASMLVIRNTNRVQEIFTPSARNMLYNIDTVEALAHWQDVVDTLRMKRILVTMLKAELFRKIVLGQIVVAEPSTVITRQQLLWADIWSAIFLLFEFTSQLVSEFWNTIGLMEGTRVQVYIETCIIALWIWAFFKITRMSYSFVISTKEWLMVKYTIKNSEIKGENRFLSKRVTSDGYLYEFVVNNKLVVVPGPNDEIKTMRVEEMALPGSELYPSSSRNVGAILVATEGTELTVVGCFFRLGEFLITAKHVANAVNSGIADVYLANIKEGKRGLFRINSEKVYKIGRQYFDIETNQFDKEFDVFAKKLLPKIWSQVGVNVSSTKTRSFYQQTVSAVGFVDGLLVTSAGKTIDSSGPMELHHTASTNKGFSGSPLYSGNSVVGMHIASDINKNVALRIELIRYVLERNNESNHTDDNDILFDFKFKGLSHERLDWDEDDYVMFDTKGRVTYRTREEEEEDGIDEDWHAFNASTYRGKNHTYRDESADVPSSGIRRLPDEKPVHCLETPEDNKEICRYLESKEDELVKLGFRNDEYSWPDVNPKSEYVSCLKHLQLYHKRVQSIEQPPNQKELDRVVNLLIRQMQNNKYEAPKNYKSRENLKRILHSSMVKDGKSPGQPYQEMGLMTNGVVLKHYGIDGFIDVIKDKWDEDYFIKLFPKLEPNKTKKLKEEMMRVICGMPLHKMVKHQSIFENFRTAVANNWEQSPIKYCFSPLVPGHIKSVAKTFKNRAVYGSDKKNWEYNCFKWIYDVAKETIVELAVQPADMDDNEFEEYKNDVCKSMDEVSTNSKYRCSNGKVVQSIHEGIMKSGTLMTIDVNSIGQVAVDNLVLMRMGYTDKQILNDFIIVAGGDDVLQSFPEEFDTETYLKIAKQLGFELSDFEITKSFNGCEFFSNRFYITQGIWQFKPVRFTKHIYNLRKTTLDNLAMSLSSHMLNVSWDREKYAFYERMYRDFRKEYPALFPVKLVHSIKHNQYKLIGVDVDC